MARITPLEGRRAPLWLRLLNWGSRRMMGQEATPLKIAAYSPRLLLGFLAFSFFVQGKSRLSAETRLLAAHLVAEINGCSWCIDFGGYMAQKMGIRPEKIAAVSEYATSPLLSAAERAALAYAEEATQVGARVSDATFETLRRHFGEREIVELAVAVAAENLYNRLNAPLEIESQGFCALPPRQVAAQRASA
jgi:AhpD family alkylhydroperoxidase